METLVECLSIAAVSFAAMLIVFVVGATIVAVVEGTVKVVPYVTMKAADGTIVMGWLASQTDMLSDDWVIVE